MQKSGRFALVSKDVDTPDDLYGNIIDEGKYKRILFHKTRAKEENHSDI